MPAFKDFTLFGYFRHYFKFLDFGFWFLLFKFRSFLKFKKIRKIITL